MRSISSRSSNNSQAACNNPINSPSSFDVTLLDNPNFAMAAAAPDRTSRCVDFMSDSIAPLLINDVTTARVASNTAAAWIISTT